MAKLRQLILRVEVSTLDDAGQRALAADVRELLARIPGEPRPTLDEQSTATGPVDAAVAAEEGAEP